MGSSGDRIGRRAILKGGMALGLQMGFGSGAQEQEDPARARPKEGDLLVKVGDDKATPLTLDDVPQAGGQILAWAMDPTDKTVRKGSRLNQVLLVRLPIDQLSAETKARAAEGVVGYTAICTHQGCEVSDWIPDKQVLFCPCHASTFDPKDGGKATDGPAPRPLPALPLKAVEKTLVVAAPLTARVYFEQN
jgi:rieske iron-sulfur protein